MGAKSSKPEPKKSSSPKSAGTITEKDRAILQLKLQRDKLSAQQKKLDRQCDEQMSLAAENLKNKKKEKALYHMRRKKALEAQANKVDSHLTNIESLVEQVEWTALEADVSKALKSGSDALAQLNKQMSIDDVEAIVEDAAEQIAIAKEVTDLLSSALTDEDESDILNELNQMEVAELNLGPKVPQEKLPEVETKKEPVVDAAVAEEEDDTPARVLA